MHVETVRDEDMSLKQCEHGLFSHYNCKRIPPMSVEDLIESLSNIPKGDVDGKLRVLIAILELQAREIAELKQIAEDHELWTDEQEGERVQAILEDAQLRRQDEARERARK